jgi:hypothetical protein
LLNRHKKNRDQKNELNSPNNIHKQEKEFNTRTNINNQKRVYASSVKHEFIYSRTKNIRENGDIFLFGGLTRITYQELGMTTRKVVKPGLSDIIDIFAGDEVPEYIQNIPVGTDYIKLTKTEYELLLSAIEEDYTNLFTYKI